MGVGVLNLRRLLNQNKGRMLLLQVERLLPSRLSYNNNNYYYNNSNNNNSKTSHNSNNKKHLNKLNLKNLQSVSMPLLNSSVQFKNASLKKVSWQFKQLKTP